MNGDVILPECAQQCDDGVDVDLAQGMAEQARLGLPQKLRTHHRGCDRIGVHVRRRDTRALRVGDELGDGLDGAVLGGVLTSGLASTSIRRSGRSRSPPVGVRVH
jgi:hypothetical protein